MSNSTSSAEALPLAGIARRLGAVVYEALLLVAIVFVAGFIALPLITPGPRQRRDGVGHPGHRPPRDPVLPAVRHGGLVLRVELEWRTAHAADEDLAPRADDGQRRAGARQSRAVAVLECVHRAGAGRAGVRRVAVAWAGRASGMARRIEFSVGLRRPAAAVPARPASPAPGSSSGRRRRGPPPLRQRRLGRRRPRRRSRQCHADGDQRHSDQRERVERLAEQQPRLQRGDRRAPGRTGARRRPPRRGAAASTAG